MNGLSAVIDRQGFKSLPGENFFDQGGGHIVVVDDEDFCHDLVLANIENELLARAFQGCYRQLYL